MINFYSKKEKNIDFFKQSDKINVRYEEGQYDM